MNSLVRDTGKTSRKGIRSAQNSTANRRAGMQSDAPNQTPESSESSREQYPNSNTPSSKSPDQKTLSRIEGMLEASSCLHDSAGDDAARAVVTAVAGHLNRPWLGDGGRGRGSGRGRHCDL